MNRSLPPRRRFASAGLAFALALATATLLWNQGRREGLQESMKRPQATPPPDTAAFGASQNPDYAARLAALRVRRLQATTPEAKCAIAGEFASLALDAHFKSAGEGVLSLTAYDEALALYREAGERRGEADTRMNRATTLGMLGKADEACRELFAVYEIFRALPGTDLQQAEALCRLGQRLTQAQKLDDAHRVLDRSLRIRQRCREENGVADCLAALGELAIQENRFAEARMLLGDAAQSFGARGKTPARAAVLGQLGDVALAEGQCDEADRLYAEGLAVWKPLKQGYWIGRFLARRAEVALAKRHFTEAERLAQQSLGLLQASNSPGDSLYPQRVLNRLAQR